MKRYIDEKALVERLRRSPLLTSIQPAWASAEGIIEIISNFPTAENVVEVVFCQDCKNAQRVLDEYGNLDFKCRKMNDYMSPTDFCSRGGRKEKL